MPNFLFLRLLFLVLVSALAFGPGDAAAQTGGRQFPPAAKRGTLVVTVPPEVRINGTAERLSPGARIKGVNNLLVLSGSLVGQSVLVNYVRDTHGLIHEVWILSPAEAQEKRSGMETITNFNFEADAGQPPDGKAPFGQLPKSPPQ